MVAINGRGRYLGFSPYCGLNLCRKSYISNEIVISKYPSGAVMYNGGSKEGLSVETVVGCKR
jgi:hypothetical protein